MDYGSIHYICTSAASITSRKTTRNSSLDYMHYLLSSSLSLSHSQCNCNCARFPASGNCARYLYNAYIIRKAAVPWLPPSSSLLGCTCFYPFSDRTRNISILIFEFLPVALSARECMRPIENSSIANGYQVAMRPWVFTRRLRQ